MLLTPSRSICRQNKDPVILASSIPVFNQVHRPILMEKEVNGTLTISSSATKLNKTSTKMQLTEAGTNKIATKTRTRSKRFNLSHMMLKLLGAILASTIKLKVARNSEINYLQFSNKYKVITVKAATNEV